MKTLEERFWIKVDFGNKDQCWNWKAAKFDGYGKFNLNGKSVAAHRVAYKISFNTDPGEFLVMHTCDNRGCCNPSHLVLGTNADNTADKVKKGRNFVPDVRGENNGNALLTSEKVLRIRELHVSGLKIKEISKVMDEPYSRVYDVVAGNRWGINPSYKKRVGSYTRFKFGVNCSDLIRKFFIDKGLDISNKKVEEFLTSKNISVSKTLIRNIRNKIKNHQS